MQWLRSQWNNESLLKRFKKLITRVKLNFQRNESEGIQKVSCLRFIFKKILFLAPYAYTSIWQRITFSPWRNQSGLLTFIHPGSHKKYSLLLPHCYIPNYTFLTYNYQDRPQVRIIRVFIYEWKLKDKGFTDQREKQ